MVKHLPIMRETQVQSLGQEDPLEKEIATHSSTLAWKIPWTEEPGRLQSMGLLFFFFSETAEMFIFQQLSFSTYMWTQSFDFSHAYLNHGHIFLTVNLFLLLMVD